MFGRRIRSIEFCANLGNNVSQRCVTIYQGLRGAKVLPKLAI